jgi:hypothetical protein
MLFCFSKRLRYESIVRVGCKGSVGSGADLNPDERGERKAKYQETGFEIKL